MTCLTLGMGWQIVTVGNEAFVTHWSLPKAEKIARVQTTVPCLFSINPDTAASSLRRPTVGATVGL
jgi:hypothetical protein